MPRPIPLLAALMLLAGCSEENDCEPVGTSDCGFAVRVQGVDYVEIGWSRRPATPYAGAEVAACHDVGEDAVGPCFEESPRRVPAFAFAGFDPATVVAVRGLGRRFRVMLVHDASAHDEREVRSKLLGGR